MLGLHPHHVARVLPSNCKATSHCAAFSQALMAALHAMVSWPWRVRWSNEKVMGNWTIKKKSDLQAPRCLVVTWEMAPSCCFCTSMRRISVKICKALRHSPAFSQAPQLMCMSGDDQWGLNCWSLFCSQPFNCVDPPNHLGMCETKLKHVHVQLCGWNVGRRWQI